MKQSIISLLPSNIQYCRSREEEDELGGFTSTVYRQNFLLRERSVLIAAAIVWNDPLQDVKPRLRYKFQYETRWNFERPAGILRTPLPEVFPMTRM